MPLNAATLALARIVVLPRPHQGRRLFASSIILGSFCKSLLRGFQRLPNGPRWIRRRAVLKIPQHSGEPDMMASEDLSANPYELLIRTACSPSRVGRRSTQSGSTPTASSPHDRDGSTHRWAGDLGRAYATRINSKRNFEFVHQCPGMRCLTAANSP